MYCPSRLGTGEQKEQHRLFHGAGKNLQNSRSMSGTAQAQSPDGLAQLYRWVGFNADSGRSATRSELRAMLDAGDPVVVH